MAVTRSLLRCTRAPLPLPQSRQYALDLEFIKFGGRAYARSLALVPFSRIRSTSTKASELNTGPHELFYTDLSATPTVVELQPREVMRLSEPLPCGNLLAAKIEKTFVRGDVLQELRAPFEAEAGEALDAFRALRRTLRKEKKESKTRSSSAATLPSTSKTTEYVSAETATQSDVDDYVSLEDQALPDSNSAPPTSLSSPGDVDFTAPADRLVDRELQIRFALSHFFQGLDPHSIPNIHRYDKDALQLLHAAPVDSRDFIAASKHLRSLRNYGKGRGGYKPIAMLSYHLPQLLQAYLRKSFASPHEWYAWLTECAAHVEANLNEVRDAHKSGMFVKVRYTDSEGRPVSPALLPGNAAAGEALHPGRIDFIECESMEELAMQTHALWCSLPQKSGNAEESQCKKHASNAKVYTYGAVDKAVLQATLQLPFLSLPLFPGLSGFAGHPADRFNLSRKQRCTSASADICGEAQGNANAAAAKLKHLLRSPYDAKTVDITRHPLFLATGFTASSKQRPGLAVALEKASKGDETAAALLRAARPHDPLWDAQALACVCSTAGVAR